MPTHHAIGFALLLAGISFGAHTKIRAGSVPDCGRLVHYVRPVYSQDAKRRHIRGTVSLRAVVGVSGDIDKIEVLKGDPILVAAALRAIKKWRYAPCLLNGDPVEWITLVEIPFTLTQ